MVRKSIFIFREISVHQRNKAALVAILLIPLFFLGTRASHDWGDDFAQYIHQAGNIVNGIPQSETGFVYSQINYIGPQAYPVGFPLLLAPVYAIAGNKLIAFTGFITLMYCILGILILIFYRKYFSWLTSLVLVLIFLYNPQMVIFKREVMSDIPFTAFLVLNFILYLNIKNLNFKYFSLLALLVGFMLIIRPAGIVFIAAIVVDQLKTMINGRYSLKEFSVKTTLFLIVPLVLYFLVNSLFFSIPSGGSIRDYLLFYYSGDFLQIIPVNFAHHLEVFRYMYVPDAGYFKGISFLLGSVMVVMTLIGFLKRMIEGPLVTEWFFIFYSLMLLVFPNNSSAFRLMVPLGFLFLFYAATGLKTVTLIQNIPNVKKTVFIGVFIFLMFLPGLTKIARSGSNILDGPQQPAAIELFTYIQKHIPSNSIVVFTKPRALALYANCRGMVDPFTTDPTLIHKQVTDAKATHLLISDKLSSEAMKRYSRVMESRLTKMWENEEFTLFRINTANPLTPQ